MSLQGPIMEILTGSHRNGSRGHKIVLGLAGLVVILLPMCANADSLVTNGGFETGDFTGWTITGPFACVGSTVSCEPSGYGLDADPGPHSGLYAAYLGGSGPDDLLSQTLATTAGQDYTLEFFLAAPSFGGSYTPNSFAILWDGSNVDTITNLVSSAYIEYTYSVTGSGSDTLEFDTSNLPAAFVLDDVTVNVIPEPCTCGLLLIGLCLLTRRQIATGLHQALRTPCWLPEHHSPPTASSAEQSRS